MVSLTPIFGGTSIPRTTVPSALLPPTAVQSIFSVVVHANIIVDNAINSPLRGFIRCPLSHDNAVACSQQRQPRQPLPQSTSSLASNDARLRAAREAKPSREHGPCGLCLYLRVSRTQEYG